MKHILLFGAGKSATVLIDYLKNLATEKHWQVSVVDGNEQALGQKVGDHAFVKGVVGDVSDPHQRAALVKSADLVISLLPPALHYTVALDCIAAGKNLLTASYVDERMKGLSRQVADKKLLFLCEMGLDPGIDHMSAMQLINRIKAGGGNIHTFKSHCGGLVAPESDNNPWHYKISWNPRNVVLAGKSGAVYREYGLQQLMPYEQLFAKPGSIQVPGLQPLAWYPNRDSLSYLPIYHLENVRTFVRTTLRHPDFCFGWKNVIDLKLTDESETYDTNGMTISEFFRVHFEKHGFSQWITEMLSTRLSFAKDVMKNLLKLIDEEQEAPGIGDEPDDSIMLVNERGELDTIEMDDMKEEAADVVALQMREANLSLKQLFFLGLDSEQPINKGNCTPAEILEFILQQKLALETTDRDMVVMVHEIGYEQDGEDRSVTSSLVVKGSDGVHTAMAQTVGLPLGIAARLVLEGVIEDTGLMIPVKESIYAPVLAELKKFGISFEETFK